jgi:type IV pilus assembly protein PilB
MSAAPPNTAPQVTTPGLARALMQGNLLTAAQTDTIVKKTQIDKTRFIDGLLQSALSVRDLATFCSETFGYPLMDLSVINESLIPDKLVDPKLMQTQRLVPIAKKGNKLALAVSDPTNNSAFDQVKFQTSLGIELIMVQHDALLKMLEKSAKHQSRV